MNCSDPKGITPEIVRAARDCFTTEESKDANRREPTVPDPDAPPKPTAADVYEHPFLQTIHQFIIDHRR